MVLGMNEDAVQQGENLIIFILFWLQILLLRPLFYRTHYRTHQPILRVTWIHMERRT